MNYKFIPDSIKIDDSIPLNYSLDEFLELQISYKQSFEKILTDIVDFAYFDNWVKNTINDLPIVNDKESNFYRKLSTLNSDYIYLRNNIHIEKLDFKELNELRSNVNKDFLLRTYKKVLFEGGNYTFFGSATDMNLVASKSLVFEFAFDAKECATLDIYNFYNHYKENILEFIAKPIADALNCNVSLHRYSAIPELFSTEDNKESIKSSYLG